MRPDLPLPVTLEVRDRCLCLRLQRAARTVARRFDEAFRPLDLRHGQFSLLMSLNRPQPPVMGEVAELLAMDRTTLTANLKPLARRGLLEIVPDETDRRSRRLMLTDAGRDLLALAVPIWRSTHDEIDALLGRTDHTALTDDLAALTQRDAGPAPEPCDPPGQTAVRRLRRAVSWPYRPPASRRAACGRQAPRQC